MLQPAQPTVLPPAKAVRDLLTDLLGREIHVEITEPWTRRLSDIVTVAEYVDDQGALRAVALVDLALSVHLGSALGLLPAGGAKDMIDARDVSPAVIENLYEVFNIVTSLFNADGTPHLRITKMHAPGDEIPTRVTLVANNPSGRLDLHVGILKYGAGRMTLFLSP